MSLATALARRWNEHWFRPAPLVDLAVCRLLVVGFQLFVMLFPYALLMYPVYGMLDHYAALPDSRFDPEPLVMKLVLLPFGEGARPTLAATQWVLRLTIAFGFLALLGWRTRTACALFAAGNVFLSSYSYSFGEHHHTDALTTVMLCALALAPSGGRLSVDAWLRRRRAATGLATVPFAEESDEARWPLLLIRWLFSIAYLSAAVCKLAASGLPWLNGWTLQHYLLQDGLFWDTGIGPWLAGQHGLAVALSWFSIGFEALFFLVLIRPRTACVLVPCAIAFHLGIWATMRAPFFLYLPLYAVFVPWSRPIEKRGFFAGKAHPAGR